MQQLLLSPLISILLSSVLCLLLLLVCLYKWNNSRDRRLPPGSMGWPFIGESLTLYTTNPNTFFTRRQQWYGNIFKTYLLGCPSVMVTTPEAAKIVLVTKAHLFKPTYPQTKEMMIGPQALFFHHGEYHVRLKKLIQSSFLPASIRGSVSQIEQIVLTILSSWGNSTINTLSQMKRFAFDVAMLSAFGDSSDLDKERIKSLYLRLEKGYNSMKLNFPFSPFRRAMKARKLLNETLTKIIETRRNQNNYGGLLGVLLTSIDQNLNNALSDSQVADNIIGVIFAAHDTTASVLTWILKYLHDNKEVLRAVTSEQENIRRQITAENRTITWDDTKRMSLTSRVIQETLRTASVLSFLFREAVEDVELEGYTIPKGWKVLPLFRRIHHCEEFFPQPEKFDPSRFEVPPRPNTFMPFGNGAHSCPGNELAKLEMLILLHHLTTTYRWELVKDDDGIEYGPFAVPKGGLPVKVTKKEM